MQARQERGTKPIGHVTTPKCFSNKLLRRIQPCCRAEQGMLTQGNVMFRSVNMPSCVYVADSYGADGRGTVSVTFLDVNMCPPQAPSGAQVEVTRLRASVVLVRTYEYSGGTLSRVLAGMDFAVILFAL